MYLDPAQILLIVILVVLLYNAYRYISWRISSWIGTVVLIFIALAIIAPVQTRTMVHQLWFWLVDAFHRIVYVFS